MKLRCDYSPVTRDRKYRYDRYKIDEVVEVFEEDGIRYKHIDSEYIITPEFVSSFAESSDYRNDLLGAIANGGHRVNLGDVTEMQEVANMDAPTLNTLSSKVAEIQAKLKEYETQKTQAVSAEKQAVSAEKQMEVSE